jgi:hypothetical protein
VLPPQRSCNPLFKPTEHARNRRLFVRDWQTLIVDPETLGTHLLKHVLGRQNVRAVHVFPRCRQSKFSVLYEAVAMFRIKSDKSSEFVKSLSLTSSTSSCNNTFPWFASNSRLQIDRTTCQLMRRHKPPKKLTRRRSLTQTPSARPSHRSRPS